MTVKLSFNQLAFKADSSFSFFQASPSQGGSEVVWGLGAGEGSGMG